VKTSELVVGQDVWTYYETTVNIGNIQGDKLVSLASPYNGKTDYDYDAIKQAMVKVEEIEKLLDKAKDDVPYFVR
jgi:hypothetical protein